MSIETEADWNGLRRVGALVRITLDALERAARPGITTVELDRIAARLFAERGARSAPASEYGFPGTVLLSVNDEVVHGIPGARRLEDGDVLKVDVTAELGGYVADAKKVGRAIFFSLAIIIFTYAHVFLLEPQQGPMFRPL